jgi:nitrogenase subunit NifH
LGETRAGRSGNCGGWVGSGETPVRISVKAMWAKAGEFDFDTVYDIWGQVPCGGGLQPIRMFFV